MKTLAAMLVGIPVAIYLVACVLVYVGQRDMMYFPTPNVERSVADDLRLETDGARLKIWHRARPTSQAMLYFGGNAEDVARSIANLRTALPDHALYLMNYRGYGGSTGEPSEAAFYADAVALYDHVKASHATISVIGRSLGSAVAAELAAVRPVAKLALITPFDSIANVVNEHFGYLPVGLLLKDRYELIRRVPAITAPVLIVLAEHDDVVPRERSVALIEAFGSADMEAIVLGGTEHNTIDGTYEYLSELRDFFSR